MPSSHSNNIVPVDPFVRHLWGQHLAEERITDNSGGRLIHAGRMWHDRQWPESQWHDAQWPESTSQGLIPEIPIDVVDPDTRASLEALRNAVAILAAAINQGRQ